jgi:hypothetical protein
MDSRRAIAFIREHGNEVELARLRYLLANERPTQEVIASLFAGQRADGGWAPFWADDYSSLDAACFRLAQAEQLGVGPSEAAIQRAVGFIGRRQSPEGSWEEEQRVAEAAPPWAKPGDLSAKLYLTANCGLWLALLGNPDERAAKAAGFLQTFLGGDGRLPGFLHTHWLAGGLWYKLNWREPAEQVFAFLEARINELAISNGSWLIITLCAAGLAFPHPLLEKAAAMLEASQADDGRWPSEDGPDRDVHATLEALRALRLCGRIGYP